MADPRPMDGEAPGDLIRRFLVSDVMATPVFTARPKESLLAAARTMRARHVSGLPVVDEKRRVLGVLSEKDIVGALDKRTGVLRPRGVLDLLLASYASKGEDAVQLALTGLLRIPVEKAMTKPAATVESDDSLGEARRVMRQYSINRLPVVEKGALVGIVTREDILEVLDPAKPGRRRYARGPRPPAETDP